MRTPGLIVKVAHISQLLLYMATEVSSTKDKKAQWRWSLLRGWTASWWRTIICCKIGVWPLDRWHFENLVNLWEWMRSWARTHVIVESSHICYPGSRAALTILGTRPICLIEPWLNNSIRKEREGWLYLLPHVDGAFHISNKAAAVAVCTTPCFSNPCFCDDLLLPSGVPANLSWGIQFYEPIVVESSLLRKDLGSTISGWFLA